MPERRFTPQARADVQLEERADGESPRITGYAAVFYDGTPETEYKLWAGMRERIMPGAFDRVLAERADVRGLFNHDPDHLLGRVSAGTLALTSDDRGLRYSDVLGDTTIARDVTEHIRRRDVTGSSFAFNLRREGQRWREEGDLEIREILEVDELFDVGPVTFPAYELTTAEVHAADDHGQARASYDEWKAGKVAASARRAAVLARAAEVEAEE